MKRSAVESYAESIGASRARLLTRGTSDRLISDASVTEFMDAPAKGTFAQFGVNYAAEMKAFFRLQPHGAGLRRVVLVLRFEITVG